MSLYEIAKLGETQVTQGAHSLAVGNVVRWDGTSYVLSQADTEAHAEVIGIVTRVADANHFTLVTEGLVTGLSGLDDANPVYYLSPSVAGGLTPTEPTTAGHVSKPLLLPTSATSGMFTFAMRGFVVPVSTQPARVISMFLTAPDGALAVGDGKAFWRVPALLNGYTVTAVAGANLTVSSSGNPTFQLRRKRGASSVDVLSTALTIDSGELDSKDALTAAVVNTSNDDLATGDILFVDCDAAGTGTLGVTVDVTIQ